MNIFVFGSNRAGRHGRGSALEALRNHGAQYAQGEGMQGKSYAIPTKDEHLRSLPLAEIQAGVNRFLEVARARPCDEFRVVQIGCGLAGYTPAQIAPFFRDAPVNVCLPKEFIAVLQEGLTHG